MIGAPGLTSQLRTLQVLCDRLAVTSHQQQIDAAAARVAVEALLSVLQPDPPARHDGRSTQTLALAIVRSGHTRKALAHLTGIPEPRLAALCAGVECEPHERAILRRIVGEWRNS